MKAEDFTPKQVDRFWATVTKTGDDECWPFTKTLSEDGYGRFVIGSFEKGTMKRIPAHRLALIFSGQPQPEAPRNLALHSKSCITRACCNPAHLRWGTQRDNMADRSALGRFPTGSAHLNCKLSDEDVRRIRESTRRGIDLAAEFGISSVYVSMIRHGKCRTYVPR